MKKLYLCMCNIQAPDGPLGSVVPFIRIVWADTREQAQERYWREFCTLLHPDTPRSRIKIAEALEC